MVVNTMHNTPFTDMNDSEGEVQQAGYAAFESGTRVVELLAAFLPACSINAGNVKRNTDAACITVTELADTLVRDEDLTFRQAHEVAAGTARSVIEQNAPLGEGYEAFRAAFLTVAGRTTWMNETTFRQATSAENFVAVRNRIGGPAPEALSDALAHYRDATKALRDTRAARSDRTAAAARQLETAFTSLLET
jgi:argininosuccinate lyase